MRRRRGAPAATLAVAVWLLGAAVATPATADAPASAQLVVGPTEQGDPAAPPPAPPLSWWSPNPAEPEPDVADPPEPATPPASTHDCSVLACVALTFDDGPGDHTAALLDALAAKGVHATFFVLGTSVEQHPDVMVRMAAEGHTIGNHSWSHPKLTTLSPDQIAWQLEATRSAVHQLTGVSPTFVRPPYGVSNATVRAVLAEHGSAVVTWDVDTQDWLNRDVEITTARALTDVEPGSIILMHDIRPTSVEAVPAIIDQLQAAGFTLVTIDELLGDATPGESYRHG